jgi:hypothetical protein
MRQVRWIEWTLAMIGLVVCGAVPALGDTLSDQPAAIVNFPYVVVNRAEGRETVLQLSNTLSTAVFARCYVENANHHCMPLSSKVCTTSAACLNGETCAPGWSATSLRLSFTALQPIGLRASNIVPENPFVGSVRCIVVDGRGAPTDQNALTGVATLERYQSASSFLDTAKYSAIGIQAIAGVNDGDNILRLGGPQAEYNGCPTLTIFNHFYEGQTDPILNTDVSTRFVLMPCSQNEVAQLGGQTTLQYLVHNEFEQPFSTSNLLDCFQDTRICDIDTATCTDSIFNEQVAGTDTAQTEIQSLSGGVLAMAFEEHVTPGDDLHVQSAAFNAYLLDSEPAAGDTLVIDPPGVPPAPAPASSSEGLLMLAALLTLLGWFSLRQRA